MLLFVCLLCHVDDGRLFVFFNVTTTAEIYTYGHTRTIHDALPISALFQVDAMAPASVGGHDGLRFSYSYTRQNDELRRKGEGRSEEHTSELQSLMRISYAVFCLKKKKTYIIFTFSSIIFIITIQHNH